MKSVEIRFAEIKKNNPLLSSYICFAKAVNGQHFGKQIIGRWFSKLVEKDDYSKRDRNALLANLDSLSNPPVEHRFRG